MCLTPVQPGRQPTSSRASNRKGRATASLLLLPACHCHRRQQTPTLPSQAPPLCASSSAGNFRRQKGSRNRPEVSWGMPYSIKEGRPTPSSGGPCCGQAQQAHTARRKFAGLHYRSLSSSLAGCSTAVKPVLREPTCPPSPQRV